MPIESNNRTDTDTRISEYNASPEKPTGKTAIRYERTITTHIMLLVDDELAAEWNSKTEEQKEVEYQKIISELVNTG